MSYVFFVCKEDSQGEVLGRDEIQPLGVANGTTVGGGCFFHGKSEDHMDDLYRASSISGKLHEWKVYGSLWRKLKFFTFTNHKRNTQCEQ